MGMRPTKHQRHPKRLHLVHQTQQALELTMQHPATLLLAATRHPRPRRSSAIDSISGAGAMGFDSSRDGSPPLEIFGPP